MSNGMFNEVIELMEEFINELSDETVEAAHEKRRQQLKKTLQDYADAANRGDAEGKHKAQQEGWKAQKKFERNTDLMDKREKREKSKIEAFREKLMNTPANAKASKKAHVEHMDAMINQYLRNKLEKILGEAFISESCFNDIINLMEELYDFNKKRKEKIAQRINKMMASGELETVRQLRNGEIMGDPAIIKKLKDLKKERRHIDG